LALQMALLNGLSALIALLTTYLISRDLIESASFTSVGWSVQILIAIALWCCRSCINA
jgi:hypothetical protein